MDTETFVLPTYLAPALRGGDSVDGFTFEEVS